MPAVFGLSTGVMPALHDHRWSVKMDHFCMKNGFMRPLCWGIEVAF